MCYLLSGLAYHQEGFFYLYFLNFCQASIKKGATDVGSSVSLWVISNARFLCILTGMLNVSVLQSQSRRARVKCCVCVHLPQLKVSHVKKNILFFFFYSVGLISITRMTRTFLFLPLKKRLHLWQRTQNASIAHNRISLCVRFLFLVLCCVTILHQNNTALLGLTKTSFQAKLRCSIQHCWNQRAETAVNQTSAMPNASL